MHSGQEFRLGRVRDLVDHNIGGKWFGFQAATVTKAKVFKLRAFKQTNKLLFPHLTKNGNPFR